MGIIYKEVDKIYPRLLQVTDLFTYPTVYDLSNRISELVDKKESENTVFDSTQEENDIKEMEEISSSQQDKEEEYLIRDNDVAIIGLGFELPNAKNLDEYWELLYNGLNAVREIPATRKVDIEKHLRFKGFPEDSIRFRKCGLINLIIVILVCHQERRN